MEEPKLSSGLSELPKEKILRTFTSIQKDDFLRKYQNEISVPSIGNREQEGKPDFLERANWAKAYKHEDQEKDEITYTIPLISSKPEEFGNLIIVKNGIITNSYVLNYIPEKKWLDTKKRRQGFGNFSGIIQLIHLDGEVFSETNYDNGKFVSSDRINARIAGCTTERIVTGYTTVCFENQCIISEVRFVDVEICESNSSAGSGDGDSGGDSSGSGGGSGSQNLGNPGPLDPEDIGYWLSTVFEGDDLNYPYHGMKAIAPDGTVYTYDADINGWLMPEVIKLENAGGISNFFNSIDFDGGIISALAFTLVSGVGERTPVGQVVVGTVLFHLWLYSIYEMSQIDKAVPLSECIDKFYQCHELKGVRPWMNCDDCLQNCRAQGSWNDTWCPL